MYNIENDIKNEQRLDAVIDYFKLVYKTKLTKDLSYDTFAMLDGEELFNKVIEANNNGLISLSSTNFNLITDLYNNLGKVSSITASVSLGYKKQFSNLNWLTEVIEDLEPTEKAYDTLMNNASYDVNKNLYRKEFSNMSSKCQDRIMIDDRVEKIIELSRKVF